MEFLKDTGHSLSNSKNSQKSVSQHGSGRADSTPSYLPARQAGARDPESLSSTVFSPVTKDSWSQFLSDKQTKESASKVRMMVRGETYSGARTHCSTRTGQAVLVGTIQSKYVKQLKNPAKGEMQVSTLCESDKPHSVEPLQN